MAFQNHIPKSVDLSSLSEIERVLQYKGKYYRTNQNNLRNLKGSSKWVLGSLLAGGLLCLFENKMAKINVLGPDNKGGEMLKLRTKYSMEDLAYNREFQKYRYTSEVVSKMDGQKELELKLARKGHPVSTGTPLENSAK